MENKKQELEYVDFVVTARAYKTTLTKKFRQRKLWHKLSSGDVTAHLPGTIIQLFVEKGQTVEPGQLLLIHQAMKMYNRVVAPVAGTVVEVNVQEGESVPKDHLMVKIEPK